MKCARNVFLSVLPVWPVQGTPDTQGRALSHVASLDVPRSSDLLELPPATMRNLELTQTLRGEDAPTLLSLLDTCRTGMGSRTLKRWILEPPRERQLAQQRLDAIAALQGLHGDGVWRALREIPFGAVRTYGTLALAVGRPTAVRAVAKANATMKAMFCFSKAMPSTTAITPRLRVVMRETRSSLIAP